MPKPEIIGSARSTYTRVLCMVCEEKGIEYVLTEKPLHAPEILAIHPQGKMPVLRHGGVELFESVGRTGYLVDDQFTFADINLLPILHRVGQFPEDAKAIAAAPHLAAYYERHAARSNFKCTDPPSGPPGRTRPN